MLQIPVSDSKLSGVAFTDFTVVDYEDDIFHTLNRIKSKQT